ncbi:hypothetical protein HYU40_01275 [Candidatus Woesearchaeota archaeon]|nr:hypothetical protein [Candidatus Woesearchaeota archaeon]
MSRMPRHYESCPPRLWGSSPLANLSHRSSDYGISGSEIKSAPQVPQPNITFISAEGVRVPFNTKDDYPEIYKIIYEIRPSASDVIDPEDWNFSDSYNSYLPEPDSVDKVVRGEFHTRYLKPADHHFGGYHPGKNARQSPSVRYVSGSIDKASKLFGLPVAELVSAVLCLKEVEEQNAHAAWLETVAAGNGHYK